MTAQSGRCLQGAIANAGSWLLQPQAAVIGNGSPTLAKPGWSVTVLYTKCHDWSKINLWETQHTCSHSTSVPPLHQPSALSQERPLNPTLLATAMRHPSSLCRTAHKQQIARALCSMWVVDQCICLRTSCLKVGCAPECYQRQQTKHLPFL